MQIFSDSNPRLLLTDGHSYQQAVVVTGKSTRFSARDFSQSNRPCKLNIVAIKVVYHMCVDSAVDKENVLSYWREMLLVILVAAFWGCCYYSCFVWMAYFMSKANLIGGDNDLRRRQEDVYSVVPYAWTINFCMNFGELRSWTDCGLILTAHRS